MSRFNNSNMFPKTYPRTSSMSFPRLPKNTKSTDEQPSVETPTTSIVKFSVPKGLHHLTNFGRFRDYSWYDIANMGQYNYLRWCANTDTIEISDSARPHLLLALRTAQDPKAKWSVKREEADGDVKISYHVVMKGDELISPIVKVRACRTCGKEKFTDTYFNINPTICNPCCRHHSAIHGYEDCV